MKNAPMITNEDRGMKDSHKAMDTVHWATGMLKLQAIDTGMAADEMIDFISKRIPLQHRKEAQHQDRGSQRNLFPRVLWQKAADAAEISTLNKQGTPKGSGRAFDASRGRPQRPFSEVGVQAVDGILAEVYGVQSTSQMNVARKRKEQHH